MIHDKRVEELLRQEPNLLVSWYLILSYAYYFLDVSLVSDALYDRICKDLLAALEGFDIDQRHMGLCDLESLSAGTAFHLKRGDYPGMAVSCAETFANEYGQEVNICFGKPSSRLTS